VTTLSRNGWTARVVGHGDLCFVVEVTGIAAVPYRTIVDCDVWLDAVELGTHVSLLRPHEHPFLGSMLADAKDRAGLLGGAP
jgi:hypothetical protein